MRLTNEIDIDAPRELVWRVITDVEQWPAWTPTVTSAVRVDDGPFRVGSAARLKQPGMPDAQWTVTELAEGARFSWQTRVRGMRMVASHALADVAVGTCSTLRIELRGIPVILLWPFVRASVARAIRRENAGLKAVCERHAEQASPA